MPRERGSVDLDEEGELLAQGYVAELGGYGESTLGTCSGACEPCGAKGDFASDEEESWLLAVRLLD